MKRRKKKKEIILIRKRYESRRNCFRSIFAGEQLRGMTHTRRIERIIVLRKGEGNSEGIVPWSFAYFTMPRTSICRKFRWPFQKLNSWERRLEGVEICQLFDVKFTRSCVFISVPPPPPPRRSILNFSLFHRMKIWLEKKRIRTCIAAIFCLLLVNVLDIFFLSSSSSSSLWLHALAI